MSDEKKPKTHPLLDLNAPLRGLANIINGKVFDPKSWTDEDDAPDVTVKANDDEEIEEHSTRTVRRGKRGTFAAAPAAPAGGSGAGKPEAGKASGEQDKETK